MTTRRFVLVTVVVAVAVGAVGAGATALKMDPVATPWDAEPATKPLEGGVTERARLALRDAGAEETVSLAGERAGTRFYIAAGRNGGRCYMKGRVTSLGDEPSLIACLDDTTANFPSPQQPVLDLSSYRGEPAPSTTQYVRWIGGFAADAVASVALLTANGDTISVPVENDIYASSRVPDEAIVKIIAVNTNGETVWSRPIGGPAPPPVR
jgi:hypothetical protein